MCKKGGPRCFNSLQTSIQSIESKKDFTLKDTEKYDELMGEITKLYPNKKIDFKLSVESIQEKIKDQADISDQELLFYATDKKIITQKSQAGIVLRALLQNKSMCRLCLAEYARDKDTALGQGGTRIIATLRDRGVNIPKNRRADCPKHGSSKPYDQLVQPYLTRSTFTRKTWSKKEREIILKAMPTITDSFSGAKESDGEALEIDHRIPVQRQKADNLANSDIEINDKTDPNLIRENYQLLTRKNNLIKDRACSSCISSNIKPSSINGLIRIEGNGAGESYDAKTNNCHSCPFAFPEKFGLPVSIKQEG